ncbi:ATP-binding protein [Streptomyces tritici]|uniref:ATP-binding protein n=1 Tax=Streptomyces tritici TaxID=2054410 RepID=UPI003AF15F8A
MDPIHPGPEEYGNDGDRAGAAAGARRGPRDPLTSEFGHSAPPVARTVKLVVGDLLLTVNPVDGSEIEACPPGERPQPPRRRSPEERADRARAAAPPVPPGPAVPRTPLLERQEERERLVQLLARGRSARVTGPAGSGRTRLLDEVAADCADLAPDGLVRLSGHHRTATELLYDLLGAVMHLPGHRPDRAGLHDLVREIGAVVVIDDIELGGAALDELLTATPECAYLLAAAPDVAAPSADAHVEEVPLAGLGRASALELLEHVVGRTLTEDEANWAGDLWFESEGLPLRFVQAGALLRQRDQLRGGPEQNENFDEFDAFGALDEAFGGGREGGARGIPGAAGRSDVPLPTLGEGAAPAALLASRLSQAARDALRFAVALGGELPHPAHLPALVGDTHADAALAELTGCGLAGPVGARYRLAPGVLTQLVASGYAEDTAAHAHTVVQHYAWWAGHPSVTPERAAAEADALIGALTALLPSQEAGHSSAVVLLARSAAPVFAAGLQWGAWERALRAGQEAARRAGEVAEEAYFHHELGVLALCTGNLERARAELDASIALRGALADKRGTLAGRRALALVADLGGGPPALPGDLFDEPAVPAVDTTAALVKERAPFPTVQHFPDFPDDGPTVSNRTVPAAGPATAPPPSGTGRRGPFGNRRNLVAAGAAALLVAVLGTAITLGATSGEDDPGSNRVTTDRTTGDDGYDDGFDSDTPDEDGTGAPDESPDASGEATPGESGSPTGSGDPTGPTDGTTSGGSSTKPGSPTTSGGTTTKPSTTKPGTPTTGGTTSGSPSGGTPSGGTDPTGGTTGETTTGETTGETTTGETTGETTTGETTGETTTGGTTGETTTGGADSTGGAGGSTGV